MKLFQLVAIVFLITVSMHCATSGKFGIDYSKEAYESYKADRLSTLQQPFGWPTLLGLFWLDEGKNSFGAGRSNELIFPEGMPERMGFFLKEKDQVSMTVEPNLNILIDGNPASSGRLFSDLDENKSTVNLDSYFWHIIKRNNQFGVRLRDTLHPSRLSLKEIPSYKFGKKWIIEASFKPGEKGQVVKMDNQVGMEIENPLAGTLTFTHRGEEHTLDALSGGEDALFVIIADATSNVTTYGGGRYMYPKKADANGKVILDFNRAENPPCVFTDYATCPLPPPQNILPFEVLAGEQVPADH